MLIFILLFCEGAAERVDCDRREPTGVVIVLARAFPFYTPPTPTFRDVPADHPFYVYIETAYHYGIVSGHSCGPNCLEFGPNATGTRAQLSKVIHQALIAP